MFKNRIVGVLLLCVIMVMSIGQVFALPSPQMSEWELQMNWAESNGEKLTVDKVGEIAFVFDRNFTCVEVIRDMVESESKWTDILSGLGLNTNLKLAVLGDLSSSSLLTQKTQIKLNVKGITSDSAAYVLHYNEAAQAWENVTGNVGDGYVTCELDSLSPVAIATDAQTLERMQAENNHTNVPTSPATGDNGRLYMNVALFIVLAVAFVSTWVMLSRKSW